MSVWHIPSAKASAKCWVSAILLLAALGTRNNKEQKITPALERKCPNGIYVERCRIPPYLPKYERNSCRISKFIGYITSHPIKNRRKILRGQRN
jgi:hypothetical protein